MKLSNALILRRYNAIGMTWRIVGELHVMTFVRDNGYRTKFIEVSK